MENKQNKRIIKPERANLVFPKRLRETMAEQNITQKQLAKQVGLSPQAVGYYCNGASSPDWEKLAQIAEYLGVSADYLLYEDATKSRDPDVQVVANTTGLSDGAIRNLSIMNGIRSHKREQYRAFINGLLESYVFWGTLARRVANAITIQERAPMGGSAAPNGREMSKGLKEELNRAEEVFQAARAFGYIEKVLVTRETACELEIQAATDIFKQLLSQIVNGESKEDE